jgi:hypothetical protein
MLWFLSLAAVVMATCIHLWLGKRPVTLMRVVEVLLLYLLVIFAGVGGLLGFLAEIVLMIGWQPRPFQFEVAVANLAFGILGVMCIWQRQGFRTATGIGYAVYMLGCAYGHFQDMTLHGNFLLYNLSPVPWVNDLAIPVVILLLLLVRRRLAVTQAETPASNH